MRIFYTETYLLLSYSALTAIVEDDLTPETPDEMDEEDESTGEEEEEFTTRQVPPLLIRYYG